MKFGDQVYLHSKNVIDLQSKAADDMYPVEYYRQSNNLMGFLCA